MGIKRNRNLDYNGIVIINSADYNEQLEQFAAIFPTVDEQPQCEGVSEFTSDQASGHKHGHVRNNKMTQLLWRIKGVS